MDKKSAIKNIFIFFFVVSLLFIGSSIGQTITTEYTCVGGTWKLVTGDQYVCSSTLEVNTCTGVDKTETVCYQETKKPEGQTSTDKLKTVKVENDKITINSTTDFVELQITTKDIKTDKNDYVYGYEEADSVIRPYFSYTVKDKKTADDLAGNNLTIDYNVKTKEKTLIKNSKVFLGGDYEYLPYFYCDVSSASGEYKGTASGDYQMKQTDDYIVTYTVTYSFTENTDGMIVPLLVEKDDVVKCYDPIVPSSTQTALKFNGVATWSLATGIYPLNGTNYTTWTSAGLTAGNLATGNNKSSASQYIDGQSSNIKDVLVECVSRTFDIELYIKNSTSNNLWNRTELTISTTNLAGTKRCVVLNQINTTIFHIFYDTATNDANVMYRRYNGTGSATNAYALETAVTLSYPSPPLGTGSTRSISVNPHPLSNDEYVISTIASGGTDTIHMVVFNTTSKTVTTNFSSGNTGTMDFNFKNTGGAVADFPNAQYTGDGSYIIGIWSNYTTPITNWYSSWNRSNNLWSTPATFTADAGVIDQVASCVIRTKTREVFFLYQTNESDNYVTILNVTGGKRSITGDTGIERNAGNKNLDCYSNPSQTLITGAFVDSGALMVDWFDYNYTNDVFYLGNTTTTTAITTTATTANWATDDIRNIKFIDFPVAEGAILVADDITNDVNIGVFLENRRLNTTKNSKPYLDNPVYQNELFYFSAVNYIPNSSTTFSNNTNVFSSIINLSAIVSDINGDTINITFYNNSNKAALCTNNTITTGTQVYCSVSLGYLDEIKWYYNITDNAQFSNNGGTTPIQSGVYNATSTYPSAAVISTIQVTSDDSDQNLTTANFSVSITGTGLIGGNFTIFNSTTAQRDMIMAFSFNSNTTQAGNFGNFGFNGTYIGTARYDNDCQSSTTGGCLKVVRDAGENIVNLSTQQRLYGTTNGLTLCAKVYYSGACGTSSNNYVVAGRWDTNGKRSFAMFMNDSCHMSIITSHDGNTLFTTRGYPAITANTWQDVCVSYGETNNTVYVNGLQTQSLDRTNDGLYSGTTSLIIGAGYATEPTTSNQWNGWIDNVRLFNWTLTAEQVREVNISDLTGSNLKLMQNETEEGENWTMRVISSNTLYDVMASKTFQILESGGTPSTCTYGGTGHWSIVDEHCIKSSENTQIQTGYMLYLKGTSSLTLINSWVITNGTNISTTSFINRSGTSYINLSG